VTADLPNRVDYVLADLLRELLELIVVELVKVLGFVDVLEKAHVSLVRM
jgi:hypothetical protein